MPRLLLSNSPGLERRKEAVREVARAEAARSRFTALKGRMVLKPKKVHSGRHTVSHQYQYPFSFKCKRHAFLYFVVEVQRNVILHALLNKENMMGCSAMQQKKPT